ncbi:MAG TPA: SigE family RNA polymerase sigma factor [Trebonia sp.]|jgi:RNA polymerase sigma-70 factor (sigma-E family)|nr:SigE family RNA polymerase sigma factor [Trebonia sp.]
MSGRDEEFREFMRNRASTLHQSAYLLCGDWHLAHDLVQDTLVKAYQHWPRVRHADSPDAYVRRILLNEARGRWRRRERVMPVPRFTEEREPATPDATDEIARRAGLQQALLALPLRQRATIVLRYLEGLSERETAAVLGCSEGTVKSQSARALVSLKSFLDRMESTL